MSIPLTWKRALERAPRFSLSQLSTLADTLGWKGCA